MSQIIARHESSSIPCPDQPTECNFQQLKLNLTCFALQPLLFHVLYEIALKKLIILFAILLQKSFRPLQQVAGQLANMYFCSNQQPSQQTYLDRIHDFNTKLQIQN